MGLSDYDSSQVGPILTRKALEFIERHQKENRETGKYRPFFIEYRSEALHGPTTPPMTLGGKKVCGATFSLATDMFVELDVTLGCL